jgi:hypothetical protein
MTHGDHHAGLGLGHDVHHQHVPELKPAGLEAHHAGALPVPGPAGSPALAAAAHLGASDEIGNPAEYQHYWFSEDNGYCVPSSVTQVIEAQTGLELHGYGVVAHEMQTLGIHMTSTGITLTQAQQLLNGFDVPSHIETPASQQAALQSLENYLAEGRNVILSVNASPIWYGSETLDNPNGDAPDHALVVSAVNDVTGTVTLSDPGSPDGNEEQVPMSTFMDAWSASGCEMLVTDDPVGGTDQHAATAAVDGIEHPTGTTARVGHDVESFAVRHGSVLLPIVAGVVAAGAAVGVRGRGQAGERPATA